MSGTSTFPGIALWVQFGKGPFDGDAGSTTWTALNLKRASIHAGRSAELDSTTAGQAVFVLDNNDRSLDPFNASGAHAGQLLPGREVRLAAGLSSDGSVGNLWSGFTEEWPQTYTPPETADVALPCVDALGLVATTTLPESVYAGKIGTTSVAPMAWYRLSENSGFFANDSSGYRNHGQFNNGLSSSIISLVSGDADSAVAFLPDNHVLASLHPALSMRDTAGAGQARSYEFWWVGRPRLALVAEFPLLSVGRGGPADFEILYDDLYGLCVRVATSTTEDTIPIDPMIRHHIVVTVTAGGTRVVYVNGSVVTTTAVVRSAPTRGAVNGLQVSGGGYSPGVGDDARFAPQLVAFDEVAVYPGVLTGTDVTDHWTAGYSAWNGDNVLGRLFNVETALRLTSLHSSATLPTNRRNWSLGSATFDMAPLEYLQALEASEQGRLVSTFDTTDGTSLALLPREPFESALTVAAAFTDDPAGSLHYEEIEVDTGALRVRNEITVKYAAGVDSAGKFGASGEVTLTDSPSVVANGHKPWTVTTLLASSSDAHTLAEYLLDRYATRRARVTKLVINPAADGRLWTVAKTLKVGDRVTVRRLPQNSGSAFTVDCRIDGIQTEIDQGVNVWRVTYVLSAITPIVAGTSSTWWTWAGSARWGDADLRWYI